MWSDKKMTHLTIMTVAIVAIQIILLGGVTSVTAAPPTCPVADEIEAFLTLMLDPLEEDNGVCVNVDILNKSGARRQRDVGLLAPELNNACLRLQTIRDKKGFREVRFLVGGTGPGGNFCFPTIAFLERNPRPGRAFRACVLEAEALAAAFDPCP